MSWMCDWNKSSRDRLIVVFYHLCQVIGNILRLIQSDPSRMVMNFFKIMKIHIPPLKIDIHVLKKGPGINPGKWIILPVPLFLVRKHSLTSSLKHLVTETPRPTCPLQHHLWFQLASAGDPTVCSIQRKWLEKGGVMEPNACKSKNSIPYKNTVRFQRKLENLFTNTEPPTSLPWTIPQANTSHLQVLPSPPQQPSHIASPPWQNENDFAAVRHGRPSRRSGPMAMEKRDAISIWYICITYNYEYYMNHMLWCCHNSCELWLANQYHSTSRKYMKLAPSCPYWSCTLCPMHLRSRQKSSF